jgi:hypothetical protein
MEHSLIKFLCFYQLNINLNYLKFCFMVNFILFMLKFKANLYELDIYPIL